MTFLLSIPPWSDFNKFEKKKYDMLKNNFQSHLGLISTETILGVMIFSRFTPFNPTLVWFQHVWGMWLMQCMQLSIPPWSDFNSLFKETNKIAKEIFQSHLGLISTISDSVDSQYYEDDAFNPTLVWFQLQIPRTSWKACRELSIPPWSDFNLVQFKVFQ